MNKMKKIKSGLIKLRDIKHIENSRIRFKEDVEDLMHDIEQRGLLQNVGIRQSDNALIYGNRRVKAFEKLGYESIPCDFYDDIDDDELLIVNLTENTKRRDITPIEIGRVIDLLIKRNFLKTEIAEKLGIDKKRVDICLTCFENVKGTPFENMITYNKTKKGIPESMVWSIQSTFSRLYGSGGANGKIPKEHWNILLKAVEEGKLTHQTITPLRNVLYTYKNISLQDAIDLLDKGKSVGVNLFLKKDVLFRLMKENKKFNEREFMVDIIKDKYPELLF